MGSVWALHHLQQFFTLRAYEEPPVFGNDHLGLAQDDSQGVFRCLRVERRILQPARPKSLLSTPMWRIVLTETSCTTIHVWSSRHCATDGDLDKVQISAL